MDECIFKPKKVFWPYVPHPYDLIDNPTSTFCMAMAQKKIFNVTSALRKPTHGRLAIFSSPLQPLTSIFPFWPRHSQQHNRPLSPA